MQPPKFSILIFLMLMSIFAASLLMFLALVRRWTTQRQWVSLSEWSKQRGFSRRWGELFVTALGKMLNREVAVLLELAKSDVALLQVQTGPEQRWNLLLSKRPARQAVTAGMRPAAAAASVLDLAGLSEFPSLSIGTRFTVLAKSSSAAHALSDSASRTLLPADIGLLLAEDWLLLDFSTRPFDPIELDRMLALAKQLGQMI
jgi:hypothetical protein